MILGAGGLSHRTKKVSNNGVPKCFNQNSRGQPFGTTTSWYPHYGYKVFRNTVEMAVRIGHAQVMAG